MAGRAAFALRPRLEAITLEVIVRLVFGIEDEARRARMRALLPALIMAGQWVVAAERVHARLGRPARRFSRFDRLRGELDTMLTEEIERRRDGGGDGARGDVLDLLLSARDEDGAGLSDAELRDQLVTVLEAGHETTATALAWTLERLVRHPAALARLTAEADAGETDEYVQAVVKEALRTRPVIGDVARILTKPLRIGGFDLPAGTGIAPAIAVIQAVRMHGLTRVRSVPNASWMAARGSTRGCRSVVGGAAASDRTWRCSRSGPSWPRSSGGSNSCRSATRPSRAACATSRSRRRAERA